MARQLFTRMYSDNGLLIDVIWSSDDYLDQDMLKPLDLNRLAQALPLDEENDASEDRMARCACAHLEATACHRDDLMF